MRPQQGFDVPIGPHQPVAEHADSEHMRHLLTGQNLVTILALEIAVLDVVQVGVRKEQLVGPQIDGQCVRPGQFVFVQNDTLEVAAVHADLSDERMMTPIREEHISDARMHGDRSRIGHRIA